MQATLELVQGQRNELREEVKKALKAAERDQEARRVSASSYATLVCIDSAQGAIGTECCIACTLG